MLNTRRTSGEIINATLLEVFLAMVFVVFALAVFQKRRAVAAEDRLERTRADSASLASVRDSLTLARLETSQLSAEVAAGRRIIDSLTFLTSAPDCEPGASPRELVAVTLAGPDRLRVVPTRPLFGMKIGDTLRLTRAEFLRKFQVVRTYAIEHHGCKFTASVHDTKATTKRDFKEDVGAIASLFKAHNFLR